MSLPGRVRVARRSELSFKVSGPLERISVEEGTAAWVMVAQPCLEVQ
jgi:hypothetical protein